MLQLLNKNMIQLPPISHIQTIKPLPPNFNAKTFFQYHRTPRHDMERCKHIYNQVQDLILIKSSWMTY